ncbi:MAG: patatin-like phospholipase family protein [Bacteriovoracia bacterium]
MQAKLQSKARASSKIRIPKKSKIALVCSGGAVKAGAYHLGVALALQEKGFKFIGGLKKEGSSPTLTGREISVFVGSSAGSIISTYLACGYSLDQIFDSFLGKGSKKDGGLNRITYGTMFSLRRDLSLLNSFNLLNIKKWAKWPGLFSTQGIERYLREDVLTSNDFRSYEADLFVVATQLNHSKKVVFGKYQFSPSSGDRTVAYRNNTRISEACAGSIALPFVFSPYAIKNEKGQNVYYFDGEVRDTLSTHVAFDAGADLIISSYTHQPYHFKKEIGSLHDYGIPAILIQALYLLIERKIQTAANNVEKHKRVYDAVSSFFKEHSLSDSLRKQCLERVEKHLSMRRDVDYIYIHPRPDDHEMFFGDHFNLSAKKMAEIVRLGFRSGIDILRRYEFED